MTDDARHFSERIDAELRRLEPALRALGRDLHRDPELGCREMHAVTRIAGELEEEGFRVETGIAGLSTAFRAEAGEGAATVAFLVEYDAIPGLGHASGHNLVVVAGCAAAIALARSLPRGAGRVAVVGAPAEETMGGKVVLAARGGYDGIDAALLAHPGMVDRVEVTSLASWVFEVTYHGRAAHAVAAPEEGIDALDALIRLFVARKELLAKLRDDVRIPGVILEGGVRPNLVPERARARFSLRAADAGYLVDEVVPRFREAAGRVATATGTRVDVEPVDNLYDEFLPNPVLADVYRDEARAAGLRPAEGAGRPVGSLDMGTLSRIVPSLHPTFSLGEDTPPTLTREFAHRAGEDEAYRRAFRAARALAATGYRLLAEPALLERARRAHRELAPRRRRADVPLVVTGGQS